MKHPATISMLKLTVTMMISRCLYAPDTILHTCSINLIYTMSSITLSSIEIVYSSFQQHLCHLLYRFGYDELHTTRGILFLPPVAPMGRPKAPVKMQNVNVQVSYNKSVNQSLLSGRKG